MKIDFSKLKNRKTSNANLVKDLGNQNSYQDDRFWRPTKNSNHVSQNRIRLLPVSKVDMQMVAEGKSGFTDDDLKPMIRVRKHSFKGPTGKWYINNSLETFGEACPQREHDGPLWEKAKKLKAAGDESLFNALKARISKDRFICGIYVDRDVNKPENNGKVFLFDVYKTILDRIELAGNPVFEGETAFDPFDMFNGAWLDLNLSYEEKTFNGKTVWTPKFDTVKWSGIGSALSDDESRMEEIWSNQHSLLAFLDRTNEKEWKTYDELKKRFNDVMGIDENGNSNADSLGQEAKKIVTEKPKTAEPNEIPSKPAEQQKSVEINDTLDDFESYLNG